MANPQQVKAVLLSVETGLVDLRARVGETMLTAERVIRDTLEALERAERALNQQIQNTSDDYHAAMHRADEQDSASIDASYNQQLQSLEQDAYRLRALTNRFSEAVNRYEVRSNHIRLNLERTVAHASGWLRERDAALSTFELPAGTMGGGLGGARAGTTIGSTGGGKSQSGGHKNPYQVARQIFLKSLVDNPDQPRFVRGWIRQELNRLERIRVAIAAGERPPGGNRRRLYGVPGYDVGHRFPNIDAPETFRLEEASMNRARPGIAHRLGIKEYR